MEQKIISKLVFHAVKEKQPLAALIDQTRSKLETTKQWKFRSLFNPTSIIWKFIFWCVGYFFPFSYV